MQRLPEAASRTDERKEPPAAVGRRPRFVEVPRVLVRAALPMLGLLPGFRGVSVAAFDRMNEPLVADNAAAVADLGFAPRPFTPRSGGPS